MSRVPNTIMVNGRRMVCRIFDAGPASFDRFTVAFKGYRFNGYPGSSSEMIYPYLASSCFPFSPQGLGQHEEAKAFMTGRHLGKRITFESCPPDVQKFILQSI